MGTLTILFNAIVDILYAIIDPKNSLLGQVMTDYRTQPINQKNADFVEQVADRIEEMQLEGRSLWQDAKRRFSAQAPLPV